MWFVVFNLFFVVVNVVVILILCNIIIIITIIRRRKKERNVLFNDALSTFYLRLYGFKLMVKNHRDSERGNPLPSHGPIFPIRNKGGRGGVSCPSEILRLLFIYFFRKESKTKYCTNQPPPPPLGF